MHDKEYFEIAGLIRKHLLELGLDEIAEFNNYAEYEGDDRRSPDGKTLVKLMLAAVDRYLAANAAETVEESLRIIAENIDEGTPPTRALVYVSDEPANSYERLDEPAEVVGLQNTAEIRAKLRRLEQHLLEDSEPAGQDGGAA